MKWKTLGCKIIFENPWFKLQEDKVIQPDGKEGTYTMIVTPPSVYIVALTEKDEVYLVGQHRYTTNVFSWEVPAGSSDGEDVLKAAKRELWEETGLEAKEWKEAGTFQVFNGLCNEIGHVFIAKALTQTQEHKRQEEGITEMKTVPVSNVLELIRSEELTDADSITALLKALLRLHLLPIGV